VPTTAPADSPLNSRFVRAMRESVASRRRGAYRPGAARERTDAHPHARTRTNAAGHSPVSCVSAIDACCLLSARPAQVGDSRVPLAERLATFDGNVRHVTQTSEVNENLRARVESMSASIARRIDAVHPGSKVWRLQLNSKACADGLVRLIWCSKLVQEPTDATGFVVEDVGSPNASLTSSIADQGMRKYQPPVARSWHGGVTACDGSIFHIPLPGMTTFREPSWWSADHAVGLTGLLPSVAEPPARRESLARVWRVHEVQQSIYASVQPARDGASSARSHEGGHEDEASRGAAEAAPRAPHADAAELVADGSSARRLAARPRRHVDGGGGGGGGGGGFTERSPRLPRIGGGELTPRGGGLMGGAEPSMPKSMARAVRMYQQDERPSGLFQPKWVGSPREARLTASGAASAR
jgi:hypothetical protein